VYERRKAARKRRIEERRNFAARYIEQDDGQDIAGT
jgi:hypothetical protein